MFFFFKNGDIIASGTQVVCTGHSCWTSTNDGHSVIASPHAAIILLTYRDETLVFMKLLLSDELLDLINCDRRVDSTSCTGIFTASVTDGSAYCREWIVLLDELKSIHVSAFLCQTHISLNGEMSRTGCLTWGGTGIIDIYLSIFPV